MITKTTLVSKIEILADGQLQIQEATYFVEDGIVSSAAQYHRVVLQPGDDVSKQADARIVAVAGLLWTAEVIDAFIAKRNAAQADVVGVE